jgi:hypothetical protein
MDCEESPLHCDISELFEDYFYQIRFNVFQYSNAADEICRHWWSILWKSWVVGVITDL